MLYRDPDNPEAVVTDGSAKSVSVTARPPVSTTYGVQVGVTTTLSWFDPDAALDTPTSPDQAILSVQLTTQPLIDPAGNFVVELMIPNPVPADHVQLVLADGTHVDATYVAPYRHRHSRHQRQPVPRHLLLHRPRRFGCRHLVHRPYGAPAC